MPDYPKMYLVMFNAATDALRRMLAGETTEAAALLIAAQQRCEELYLAAGDDAPAEE